MTDWRLQVELPYTSGLPADKAVNVWHCTGADPQGPIDMAAALVTFYQAIDGAILGSLLSTAAGACSIKAYRMSDPEPRAPVVTQTFTLAPQTTTLPAEVALCVSFQGSKLSGVPQARRRGRIYLGPIYAGAASTTLGQPLQASIDTVVTAITAFLAASDADADWEWSVWSEADQAMVKVTDGWIDNEWDTQRRRGRRATVRNPFT